MVELMKDNIKRIVSADAAQKWRRYGFAECKTGEGEVPPSPVHSAGKFDVSSLTTAQLKEQLSAGGVLFGSRERKAELINKYLDMTSRRRRSD